MKVYPIPGVGYGSNSYLVKSDKTALVDTGTDYANIIKETSKLNIQIDYLILTHEHYDHVALASQIVLNYNTRVYAHQLAAEYLEVGDSKHILCDLFNTQYPPIKVDVILGHGDVIDLGEARLKVIYTPGHSAGSVCLYERDSGYLFSGDVVFRDGIGRSDLPGGDFNKLMISLDNLHKLYLKDGVKRLLPGHGPLGEGRDLEKNHLMYSSNIK
ncbi:MAG: MBL fold metallo-hydrolase [Candidatus Altiarchaeales archaeon ex4484_96]|nr:MAG: MBL fold metallo-hydrolase [Candidatus Altiarchaeales archaeon ex4484_96]